ncbi:replication initiator protein A (plasmid) [Haloimpatiens sp. FM7330]|uniref:replication initiator protein A n=1 Tax=Haloimpatiens sp. FM7330 TaxID=3298610 RepID=UPI0036264B55
MGEESKKQKTIQEKSFLMDINMLESPFFIFKQSKKLTTAKQLEEDKEISKDAKKILKFIAPENQNTIVEYRAWQDSRGFKRELLTTSIMKLPNGFTMDVWYALVGLYIKKSSPISFNHETNTYDIQNSTMYFTLYELAKFMKVTISGNMFDKLKEAIIQLKTTQYFSFGCGTIYDKKIDDYIVSRTKGISLIDDFEITEIMDCVKNARKKLGKQKCWVKFNNLIIDNIKCQYIKFLNPTLYFSLPSGLTRRLYSYIENNKYQQKGKVYKYIKRSYDILSTKLPVDFKYPSEFKRRLEKPLENLIKFNTISDYFFGDDMIINNVKERCIYIIFEGKKESVINQLTHHKQLEIEVDKKETSFEMKIPENLKKYLINKGFNEKIIGSFLAEYDKWEIIKYCLWLEEKEYNNKKSIRDFSAMLTFSLKTKINIENTHKHIIEFIEKNKKIKRNSIVDRKRIIEIEYQKYLDTEIQKLKKEDEGAYKIIYDTVLDNLNSKCETQIKQFDMFDKDITENERENWENQKKLWLEFEEKNENSELFKDRLQSTIRDFRKLKYFDEFKREYK